MLDINWIKANPDAYDAALGRRGRVPFSAAELIAFDDIRRAAILALEEAQARPTVKAGTVAGMPEPRVTSRAMFGSCTDWITVPYTT